MSPPLYKKALITGATSGIGRALAAKLISTGTKVIVVGRRQERLDEFVKTHGSAKAAAVRFDVTNLAGIKAFAEAITKTNRDLDCVVINSGIQRGFDFTKPETLDLAGLGEELTVNYLSAVHLTAAFLPHLKARGGGHLVYVSATLALVPSLIRSPNYNASKAALHAFIMDVRQQLQDAGSSTRLVEVFPPAVQTELHDENHQPDLVNGGEIGIPLNEFIESMYEGLVRGEEQFAVGIIGEQLLEKGGWEAERQTMFQTQQTFLKVALKDYVKK